MTIFSCTKLRFCQNADKTVDLLASSDRPPCFLNKVTFPLIILLQKPPFFLNHFEKIAKCFFSLNIDVIKYSFLSPTFFTFNFNSEFLKFLLFSSTLNALQCCPCSFDISSCLPVVLSFSSPSFSRRFLLLTL